MRNPNANESESPQIESIEREIEQFRSEQARIKAEVLDLMRREDPVGGLSFHEEIFRLQQDKLRIDTEIQFLQVKLRRLQAVW